jgi:protein involved in polysaccharide export with SLBB domain
MCFLGAGCATTGPAGGGIIMVGDDGNDRVITSEEITEISGVDRPYYLQVGDVVNFDFKMRTLQANETPWDYKLEVGDSMEVRVSPASLEPGEYQLAAGDVIGISFLDNWQMNVTRTIRPDGMVTAPEVGDIVARGLTSNELRGRLKSLYEQSGIIEGEPRITVNVDFVNLDRYEAMSRDVIIRPDGAIMLPQIPEQLPIAGKTIKEATAIIEEAATRNLQNDAQVSLVIFPAVDTNILGTMTGAVQVRPDGKLSVPRIGDMQAAGYSVDELDNAITEGVKNLTHNPVEVSVDLLKATGGRIYVGGEVNTPGVYPLEGAPSALQAVLMANGFQDTSRLNSVIVMRRNPNGKPYVFKTNLRVAIIEGATENDILLRPFDVVYVPKKTISKLNLYVEQYIEEMVPFDNNMGVNAQYYMNEQDVNSKSKSFNFNTGITGLVDVLNP